MEAAKYSLGKREGMKLEMLPDLPPYPIKHPAKASNQL